MTVEDIKEYFEQLPSGFSHFKVMKREAITVADPELAGTYEATDSDIAAILVDVASESFFLIDTKSATVIRKAMLEVKAEENERSAKKN